jgi:TfoX/Sxy family transcriptional regulator of competence genes
MAYDKFLSERIRSYLNNRNIAFSETRVMGGVCYMIDDKMCVGVIKNDLMARIDPATEQELLLKQGARPMDFTKRPMKGYVFIDQTGTDMDRDLESWIQRCLDFNPSAKSSKKN